LLAVLVLCGCPFLPNNGEDEPPQNRKVLESAMGDVTNDTRFVEDAVKYRIDVLNDTGRVAHITVIEEIDPAFTNLRTSTGGVFDGTTRSITWTISGVAPGESGSVSFTATASKVGTFRNKAEIVIREQGIPPRVKGKLPIPGPGRVIKRFHTNKVVLHIVEHPKLGWVPFDPNGGTVARKARVYMKEETTTGTMVNFDFPGMRVQETKVDGVTYHRLSMQHLANRVEVGKPAVPTAGQFVEVPFGVSFEIEVVQSESTVLSHYNVHPAQPLKPRQHRRRSAEFVLDAKTYLKNRPWPHQPALVRAEDVGVVRGHRLALIRVNPVQFDPVAKTLTAYSRLEVRLKFSEPAQIRRVDERLRSPVFEQMLSAAVPNFKDVRRFASGRQDGRKENGCDYLILTHGDFYDPTDANDVLTDFKEWKEKKGYITRVIDIANIDTNPTAADIRDYLQDVYDKWAPVPAYVLLVGDSEFLPTNDGLSHGFWRYSGAATGTDLLYATVDGNDHYPDMFVGRLSVDTLAEAEDVLEKIIAYEQTPPVQNAYYTDSPLVCLFEDVHPDNPAPALDGNRREDPTFRIIEFAEEIFDFLDGAGYAPNRVYDHTVALAGGPRWYENGAAMTGDVAPGGAYQWDGDTAEITTSINNGSFLVTFDGHGLRDLWGRPRFDGNDAAGLGNANLPTVVFSLACETGWFDNETDDDATLAIENSDTANGDECLCEEFLRHATGGAVAIIGASRVSYEENDFMMLGMFEAIWPGFRPNPPFDLAPLPDIATAALVRMGQIHTFSKVYMAESYDDDELQFQLYHLFGDPEMPLWTEEPEDLDVRHPAGIGGTGHQDFVVRVLDDASKDPVLNATVTLVRGGTVREVRQTNPGGIARFTLTDPGTGDYEITVTALNYRPYMDKIMVPAGSAVLNRLDPSDGPVNQAIHVGGTGFSGNEQVEIHFDGQLAKTATASGGSFGQAGVEDVDITVPAGLASGPVNVELVGKTSGRRAVDVFQVRKENPVDLYTYSQWDDSTWTLHPGSNPVWDNPEIQLYDAGTGQAVASNNLHVGQNYRIRVRVHNDTAFLAKSARVTFKWIDCGVGQPDRVWSLIDSVEVDVPAAGADAEVVWAPPSTGHLCVKVEIYHVEDINEANNKGQENLHVGPTSSPAVVPFTVWNPTDRPAAVHLEVRQLLDPEQGQKQRLWATRIEHPDPQMIPPGKWRIAKIVIDPAPADAKRGDRARFALTAFISGRMIGGVNFVIENKD
jgi:hypothetical protein